MHHTISLHIHDRKCDVGCYYPGFAAPTCRSLVKVDVNLASESCVGERFNVCDRLEALLEPVAHLAGTDMSLMAIILPTDGNIVRPYPSMALRAPGA